MNKYKLIALDLDETLLMPDSTLSAYSIDVLRKIDAKGVKVVFCTGRIYEGALYYAKELGLDNPSVFCNGAQIRTAITGTVMEEAPLPLAAALEVIRLGQENNGHARIYMDGGVYVSEANEDDKFYSKWTRVAIREVGDLRVFLKKAPLKIINLMPDDSSIPAILRESEAIFGDTIYYTQSMNTFVEFMNVNATKGKGLQKLAAMWNIKKEEIVAAGDHFNDIPMLEAAGLALAPANAQTKVREIASVVCDHNGNDGVTRKLAEIFL